MELKHGELFGPVPAFLREGGICGELVRAINWSESPLGPVESWPTSLKTMVGVVLRSRHPMFLWWGSELVQFYNDAYLPSFGAGKHPAAMGQRGASCWQEIWPIIWPQIDDVMQRGKSSWNEDALVPIFRNGRIEEVFWTYGYSAVFDDAGDIGGTLVVCTETTARVIADRRALVLRTLSERTSEASPSRRIADSACEVFAEARADIPFAVLYRVDQASGKIARACSAGLAEADASVLDLHLIGRLSGCSKDEPISLPRPFDPLNPQWPEPIEHATVKPVLLSSGAVRGYVVFGLSPRLPFDRSYQSFIAQIIEEMRQAEARLDAAHIRSIVESERNSLLEQAPVATAIVLGPEHVFELTNASYLEMVGRTDLVGKKYLDAFPEVANGPLPGIFDGVYETGVPFVTQEMRVPLRRPGSGEVEDAYFKFNLEPLRDAQGAVFGMMVVAVDITQLVLARKDLESGQAEREILVKKLEGANRAKDEFLAMLGHELRNPLSPILTALQLMRLRGVSGADKEREIIERQVRHLVTLVDDLLDVSRITRGVIELKRTHLQMAGVIAKAIEQASPLIEQRRHRLTVNVPDDLFVNGDGSRLAQVVANALTNAAKYTEPNGAIDVRGAIEDNEVVVRVRDTGIGISAEMMPRVFDSFAQERQHSDRPQGGLGLGLAIVKSLVTAHGGSVKLVSQGRGHGTECIIRLPMAKGVRSQGPAISPPASIPTGLPGRRILLVDDNEDATRLLAESLRSLGHHVKIAFDAAAALELANSYVADVAILDLGLPVIDGYELATRLRYVDGWSNARFVALTGYGQQHDRERSRATGFAEHLVKPIDLAAVDAAIRGLTAPD